MFKFCFSDNLKICTLGISNNQLGKWDDVIDIVSNFACSSLKTLYLSAVTTRQYDGYSISLDNLLNNLKVKLVIVFCILRFDKVWIVIEKII